jgi:hypothetical protein
MGVVDRDSFAVVVGPGMKKHGFSPAALRVKTGFWQSVRSTVPLRGGSISIGSLETMGCLSKVARPALVVKRFAMLDSNTSRVSSPRLSEEVRNRLGNRDALQAQP